MFVRAIGVQGDGPGQFARPKGVAIDGDGRVYVADAAFSNVQMFDARGRLLLAFARMGSGDGELWMPEGLSLDGASRLYVSDRFNNRIQIYEAVRPRAATTEISCVKSTRRSMMASWWPTSPHTRSPSSIRSMRC